MLFLTVCLDKVVVLLVQAAIFGVAMASNSSAVEKAGPISIVIVTLNEIMDRLKGEDRGQCARAIRDVRQRLEAELKPDYLRDGGDEGHLKAAFEEIGLALGAISVTTDEMVGEWALKPERISAGLLRKLLAVSERATYDTTTHSILVKLIERTVEMVATNKEITAAYDPALARRYLELMGGIPALATSVGEMLKRIDLIREEVAAGRQENREGFRQVQEGNEQTRGAVSSGFINLGSKVEAQGDAIIERIERAAEESRAWRAGEEAKRLELREVVKEAVQLALRGQEELSDPGQRAREYEQRIEIIGKTSDDAKAAAESVDPIDRLLQDVAEHAEAGRFAVAASLARAAFRAWIAGNPPHVKDQADRALRILELERDQNILASKLDAAAQSIADMALVEAGVAGTEVFDALLERQTRLLGTAITEANWSNLHIATKLGEALKHDATTPPRWLAASLAYGRAAAAMGEYMRTPLVASRPVRRWIREARATAIEAVASSYARDYGTRVSQADIAVLRAYAESLRLSRDAPIDPADHLERWEVLCLTAVPGVVEEGGADPIPGFCSRLMFMTNLIRLSPLMPPPPGQRPIFDHMLESVDGVARIALEIVRAMRLSENGPVSKDWLVRTVANSDAAKSLFDLANTNYLQAIEAAKDRPAAEVASYRAELGRQCWNRFWIGNDRGVLEMARDSLRQALAVRSTDSDERLLIEADRILSYGFAAKPKSQP